MSVSLLVAARKGDPGAFARLVEHWDPWLRPFVHHTLGAEGNTDQVLAATYVRAYRALPRYQAERTPGLWLHRIAYLVATDELRRIHREVRRRRRASGDGRDTEATPVIDLDAPPDVPPGWHGLGPDQRAFAVMVDLEGFDPDAVADALDTVGLVVTERLAPARRVLARCDPSWTEPEPDPAPEPDPEPPLPSWMVDPLPRLTEPDGPEAEARRHDEEAQLARAARGVLAGLPVPSARREFWPGVGRRLLAERDSPAAPTIDPVARLARAHPAEPGFAPIDTERERRSKSVSVLAVQADGRRPKRRWGRAAGVALAVVAVAGLVAAAVSIGLSGHARDGSVPGAQLARTVSRGLAVAHYQTVRATVAETGPTGSVSHDTYRVHLADDGSWAVSALGRVDLTTFDAPAGLARHAAVVGGGGGDGSAATLATEDTGLAPGAPDPVATGPGFLDDLRALGPLLRTGSHRAAPTHLDGMATWSWTGSGPSGARWRVVVRRSDGMPLLVEQRKDGRLVRRTRLSRWKASSGVPFATFRQGFGPGVVPTVTAHGYLPTELSGVSILGRGPAVTPAWLPSGFEVATVAILPTSDGRPTTGGGRNPTDVSVTTVAFQRGIERITVTTRVALDPSQWSDPFAGAGSAGRVTRRTLGNGRYNGTEVRVTVDAAGRARLWGIADGTLFTVSGDLTTTDALRLAASLR